MTVDAGHGRARRRCCGSASSTAAQPQRATRADPTTLNDVYFRVGGPHVGKADVQPRGQQRRRAHRPHLGLAGGPRRRRLGRLDGQHRPQRRRRQRRRRHRDRPLRRALPAVQRHLERRARPDRVLPERAAVRPARTRRRGSTTASSAGPPTRWPTRSGPTSCGAAGRYIFTNVDPTIHASRGFEVPVTPGVRLHHVLTVNLSAGTIDHVVNDTGAPVDNSNTGTPSYVAEYP